MCALYVFIRVVAVFIEIFVNQCLSMSYWEQPAPFHLSSETLLLSECEKQGGINLRGYIMNFFGLTWVGGKNESSKNVN